MSRKGMIMIGGMRSFGKASSELIEYLIIARSEIFVIGVME